MMFGAKRLSGPWGIGLQKQNFIASTGTNDFNTGYQKKCQDTAHTCVGGWIFCVGDPVLHKLQKVITLRVSCCNDVMM